MRAFWFAPESPRPLALLRMAVGLVFLYDAAVRWPHAIELYSAAGLPMPAFPAGFFPGTHFEPSAPGAAAAVALHSLLIFALLAVIAGWQTRLSLWLVLMLSLWLGLLDHAGTFKKYSVIGLHLVLLLGFTRCGRVWSVDALVNRRHGLCRLGSAWPRRLMQVLVAAVYLGSAVTKIRLPDFANGDLLMFSLLDDQWGGTWLGLWLSTRPRLLVLASMGTVLYEIAFPLLSWNHRLRCPLLVLAFAFHLLLALTMHLGIFSAVMLCALLAFVEEHDLRWLPKTARGSVGTRSTRRSFISSALSWMAAAAVFAVGGVWFHPGADRAATASFQPVDDETAADILAALTPAQKGHYEDYFHRVELGNRLSADGTRALGDAGHFLRGVTVHACARLIGNHPPLRIEWTLVRPDGREARFAYRLAATVSHATVGFALNDRQQTPPGEYLLILRADGHHVATRGFLLRE